ncbi:hypothetical protein [Fodinicurvata fenggangensis]|uniref:hypothetical protein n=1 Tax=Fodinicurvata fenggangensis TaxID=1121830 RepID=UPI00047CA210|nr:hypothetical protein [Fodinicurvata fenggangensis]
MSPLQILHASYDGPIPADRLAAAREAERHYRPTPQARIGRVRRKPHVTIETMAAAMLERYAAEGACAKSDLLRLGFTESEIRDHAEAAADLARHRAEARGLTVGGAS